MAKLTAPMLYRCAYHILPTLLLSQPLLTVETTPPPPQGRLLVSTAPPQAQRLSISRLLQALFPTYVGSDVSPLHHRRSRCDFWPRVAGRLQVPCITSRSQVYQHDGLVCWLTPTCCTRHCVLSPFMFSDSAVCFHPRLTE